MTRSVNPVPQYLDDAGDPLIDGKMFYFESGTDTPKPTFADVNQTIPNTHPVDLTADGLLPPVFFTGSAKQILTSIDGQRWVRDPVGSETGVSPFDQWSNLVIYTKDSFVIGSDGLFYLSLKDGNQGNDPVSTPASWSEIRYIRVYNVNETYTLNRVVQGGDGNLYGSQVDGNINNDPVTDSGANWRNLTIDATTLGFVELDDVRLAAGNFRKPLCELILKNIEDFTGVGTPTFTRASTATHRDRYNVRQSDATDTLRFEAEGALLEGPSTNEALHSADLTNAAWIKSNATVAKDEAGLDGVASSASSFLSTAANATVLQTVTKASEENTYHVAIKRLTGAGGIDITIDGGSTWTPVTIDTSDYTDFEITNTAANPQFGVRVQVSGDKVAVDEDQLENLPFASSYIPTTTAAVARAADLYSMPTAGNIPKGSLTAVCDFDTLGDTGEFQRTIQHDGIGGTFLGATIVAVSGDINAIAGSSGSTAAATGAFGRASNRSVITHDSDALTSKLIQDGVLVNTWQESAALDPNTATQTYIGARLATQNPLYGHISRIAVYDTAFTDTEAAII